MRRAAVAGAAAALLAAAPAGLGAARRIATAGGAPVLAGDARADRFVAVWAPFAHGRSRLVLRVLDGRARPHGPERTVVASTRDFVGGVSAAYLPSARRVLVAWTQGSRRSTRSWTYARAFSLAGRPAGPRRRLTRAALGGAVVASDRGFLLAYAAQRSQQLAPAALALSPTGAPRGAPRLLGPPRFGADAVAAWQPRSRRFLVLMDDMDDIQHGRLDYRVLAADGRPVTAAAPFAATPGDVPGAHVAVAAPRGRGWVALWSEGPFGPPAWPLNTRTVSASGALGAAHAIPDSTDGAPSPALAFRPGAARGLLTWTHRNGCRTEIAALALSGTGAPAGHARRVTSLGSATCPHHDPNSLETTASGAAEAGALAAARRGYLLVFSGQRTNAFTTELFAEPL